jgi:hypothetical protein
MNFLVVKRSKNSYIEILESCKKIYMEKFQTELNILVIHGDAEIGFINAAKFVFPDIEILLCSVHLIRTFQKYFIKKFPVIFIQIRNYFTVGKFFAVQFF